MVGITIDPYTTSSGAFRSALIFTFLLKKIVAREHSIGEQMQTLGMRLIEKTSREDDLVEEIPLATINKVCQCLCCKAYPTKDCTNRRAK